MKLNAWSATKETREFLRRNDLLGPAYVGGSRTDRDSWFDEAGRHFEVTIRTIAHMRDPWRREDVITAAREQLSDLRGIHRLDRDDDRASYCDIAIVRGVR